MVYSTKVKDLLTSSINELSQQPKKYAVHPEKDFTRNRKLGFTDLISMLLTMEGDCIKEELYRYYGRSVNAPGKAAFHHQRAKLKDDTLWNLLQIFNQKFSLHNLYMNQYQLIACDGSAVDIFRDENDQDTYFEPNGKSPRGFNQIHINALFSITDQKFLDVLVQPGRKRNEYEAFCKMVDRMEHDTTSIYIADRGYASYNNFAHVIEKKHYFLIRCTDAKTEKLLGFPLENVREVDYHIDRILCRTQSKNKHQHPERDADYRYVCPKVPMDFLPDKDSEYPISLRVIRIEISPNNYENLITNLPDVKFDMEELKELYHLRWSQETAYRELKYPLCMKAFHSKKYSYIVQEVLARTILYNYSSEIAQHTEPPADDRKLTYQVNFSEAVKICRDHLRGQQKELDVEGLIADNVEPIRPDRTFRRQARFKLPLSFCYRN